MPWIALTVAALTLAASVDQPPPAAPQQPCSCSRGKK